jgi:OmpA-OmpF porin, OOP family
MLRILRRAVCVSLLLLARAVCFGQEPDAANCKDNPLFNRMPGFYIQRCDSREFESHGFGQVKGQELKVEGRYSEVLYMLQPGAKEPGRIQIQRNYENAITKIGGSVVSRDDDGNIYLKVAKNGKEFWVHVNAYITSHYMVYIVEKGAMAQDVQADAAAFANGIKTEGRIAIYGIHFDTGKSEIKPESEANLGEIAKMLKSQPALKLSVVGHTDNVAAIDLNMRLSQARAEAVVQALVTKYRIAAGRLKAYGVGPLAPVASNDTDEGRAKNRRVELVKP